MATYSSLTVDSPNLIKRWSHKARHAAAKRLIDRLKPKTVLDYGAGDGMLRYIYREDFRGQDWTLYEPFLFEQARDLLKDEKVVIANTLDDISGTFDLVICQEVLEHLPDDILATAVKNLAAYTREYLFVSVPMEVGPASLFKNVVRVAMKKPHENTSLASIASSLFYQPERVPRTAHGGYIPSHLGFDYRSIKSMFPGMELVEETFSPIGGVSFVNSQVNLLFRKPRA